MNRKMSNLAVLAAAGMALAGATTPAAAAGTLAAAGTAQTTYTQGDACDIVVRAVTDADASSPTLASPTVRASGFTTCTRTIDSISTSMDFLVAGVAVKSVAGPIFYSENSGGFDTTFSARSDQRQVRYCVVLKTAKPLVTKTVCATTTPTI